MKKKNNFIVLIIIILVFILIIMCYFYFKDNMSEEQGDSKLELSKVNEENINNTILTAIGEVQSGLSENIDLHATYYLDESYITTNQLIKSGAKIIKYTNGKYLNAPYDLIITETNIPKETEQCTYEHYISISSINNLKVQFYVDETKINNINIGQEVKIKIDAYEDKIMIGNITNISSTANNGKFTVTVEFENDGDIMIGMTANITLNSI